VTARRTTPRQAKSTLIAATSSLSAAHCVGTSFLGANVLHGVDRGGLDDAKLPLSVACPSRPIPVK
jgi:hypothetical protein